MSLFGTSPEAAPQRNLKSSLFDDEVPEAGQNLGRQGGSSLFAAEGTDENDSSPWGFPTPRRQARSNPVKTLLTGADVPEGYIDAYDALLESGESASNGVSLSGVRKMLSGCNISPAVQSQIIRIVGEDQAGLGRSEFNVVLACVGLAQEGEDVSLDGVDERKRRLPQPRLPKLRSERPPPPSQQAEQPIASQDTSSVPREGQTREQGFSYASNDSDPWGTPAPRASAISSSQYGANGVVSQSSASQPQRTTSTFTTTDQDTPSMPSDTPNRSSQWSTYNGNSVGDDYDQANGFSEPVDRSIADLRASRVSRSMGASRVVNGVEEIVTVNTLQEKEGMFMFQHRNYEVASTRRNSKVIRRYSDFVWLLDSLHKVYPFRQLPLLPPKRVAINGNPIAADALFLEKRRRGLARFINAIIRHPVLNQEQLVIMFLTVPTELSVWRKQANLTVLEEFTNKPLPSTLEASLPADLDNLISTVRSGVLRSSQTYINLCTILERLIKRNEGIAIDTARLSSTLQSLTELSSETYPLETNDVPLLNDGLSATARHTSKHQELLLDEARAYDELILEDVKSLRDSLVSMRDLFDRHDRLARNNIPALEKRIQASQAKLASTQAKPDAQRKPGDVEKIEEGIVKDQEEIKVQHARGVFIKECMRDEITIWMGELGRVGRFLKEWASERCKFAELVAENWRGLEGEVEGLNIGEGGD